MSSPYVGQIQIFAFGFAPQNCALCQGQILPINQNTALFSILGTYYGGNGQNTFALPDLRGRVPFQFGSLPIGAVGGTETVTLIPGQMPVHTHTLMADSTADSGTKNAPANNEVLGVSAGTIEGGGTFDVTIYGTSNPTGQLDPNAIAPVGGAPHNNMMPYLTINYSIALFGIFPSRN